MQRLTEPNFSIFNGAIGQPLPEEEPLNQIEGNAKAPDKNDGGNFGRTSLQHLPTIKKPSRAIAPGRR